jgi:hypothetical protein
MQQKIKAGMLDSELICLIEEGIIYLCQQDLDVTGINFFCLNQNALNFPPSSQ